MFIDIHAHAYRRPCPPQDGRTVFCTPDQVIKRYDQSDISQGVLLPLIGPEVYLPQSNEDILEMCENSGGRFIPFCNIDPRGMSNSVTAPFNIWLDHYKKQGCKGVGEVMPNLPFMDPLCQNLFKHVEDSGLPLIFDISTAIGGNYGFYDDPGLPQLEYTLQRFPKLIILGHGPAYWAEIGTLDTPFDRAGYPQYPVRAEGVVPKLFRRYPNMYGDLSAGSGANAFLRDPDYAIKFLNEFQDRLLYGTDICKPTQAFSLIDFLLDVRKSGKLSESAFIKIARGNAIKLLGLKD
jgi:predicted TIM-barrel fold metal-dependent hydrolase